MEVSGTIHALGPDVEDFAVGDRVVGSGTNGGYSTHTIANSKVQYPRTVIEGYFDFELFEYITTGLKIKLLFLKYLLNKLTRCLISQCLQLLLALHRVALNLGF